MSTVCSRSPQRPDDVIVQTAETTADEVRRASQRARIAQNEWMSQSPLVRAQALADAADSICAAADEIAELITREVGKTCTEARAEVSRSQHVLQYHAHHTLAAAGQTFPAVGPSATLLMTLRSPRGVAGLITPWNFPLAIPMWKLAPAIALGNAVLLKPAPQATAVALRLGEIVGAHLPDNLLQVLPGAVPTAQAVLKVCDAVSFTGSVTAGRAVIASATAANIAVQAEMGGHNASVVFPDVDVRRAAQLIAEAAMEYAGQKCTATRRVIIVGESAPFTDAIVAAVESLRRGDPAREDTVVGPVIDETSRNRVVQAARLASESGGRVLTGGTVDDAAGWFVAPAVIDGLSPQAPLAQEEIFGPLITLHHARDEQTALKLVNCTRYGLSAAVFTDELDVALRFAGTAKAGLIKVNSKTTGADLHVPFGGEGQSGYGPKEQGMAAAELFTVSRTVTVTPSL